MRMGLGTLAATNNKTTTMSEFKFSCPHCDRHIQCDERYSGKQIQCPACDHLITIPISAARLAAGHNTVQSGMTWDTFLPGNKVEVLKGEQPPQK